MQNSWEKSSENVNMTLRCMTNIKLTKESITILGVICKKKWYNKKNEDKFNFWKTVKIICNVTKLWHMRKLSLEGKITIFNLKVLFRTYNFITKRITRNENIFWNKNTNRCKTGKTAKTEKLFLGKKKVKIKQSTWHNYYKDGGLKSVDIECKASLWCFWVKRLYTENFDECKIIPLQCVKKLFL